MEQGPKSHNHRPADIESEPRIIGKKIYRNPIQVCYDIDDVIFRIAAGRQKMPEKILQTINRVLALTESVRDLFFIKEKHLDVEVDTTDLLELAKNVKNLSESEEFWALHTDPVFKKENNNSERRYNPAITAENKEELKIILDKFADLLNYFALENYTPGRYAH